MGCLGTAREENELVYILVVPKQRYTNINCFTIHVDLLGRDSRRAKRISYKIETNYSCSHSKKKNNSKLTTGEPITKHRNLANSLFFIDESISQSHLVTKHYVDHFTQICVSDPPL